MANAAELPELFTLYGQKVAKYGGHGACVAVYAAVAVNLLLTGIWQLGRMMMRLWSFLLVFALSACGAQPAPEFFNAARVDVTRDGRNYTVYHTDKRVEVIRLGYAGRGSHQAIRANMIALIPEVTGCRLIESSLQGDSGEMRGSIRCPGA